MKKKSELIFSAIQVPIDAVMIVLASLSAFVIRNIPEILLLKPKLYDFPLKNYLLSVLMLTPIVLLIYAIEGLYNLQVTRRFWREALKVFSATSIALVIVIVTIFLKREFFSSRFIILAAWLLVVLFVAFGRYLLRRLQKSLLISKGIGVHQVLLIGSNGKMDKIKKIIEADPSLGYRIVDHVDSGSIKAIREIKKQKGLDEIIVCDSTLTDEEQEKLIDYCAINNIAYKFIPSTLQTSRMEAGIFSGEPIIEVRNTPLEGWGKILKRTFDIFASILLIILFAPLMLLVACLIKLESYFEKKKGGPIVYQNERIGGDGKKFKVLKFRYMKWEMCTDPSTPEGRKAIEYEKELIKKKSLRKGPLYKIQNDPRKTKVGAFIEKYSIDELPQFFNVLRGEMSLVGPRPHQQREVEKYSEYHRRLLTIKPGVTGMAQVSGRSDLQFEDEYKLDVYYIENWSLWQDIQICLKTVLVLFKRRRN
ncbi:MAG: sugar transferase [Candidatus Moraniibacteriota bacterium]